MKPILKFALPGVLIAVLLGTGCGG